MDIKVPPIKWTQDIHLENVIITRVTFTDGETVDMKMCSVAEAASNATAIYKLRKGLDEKEKNRIN